TFDSIERIYSFMKNDSIFITREMITSKSLRIEIYNSIKTNYSAINSVLDSSYKGMNKVYFFSIDSIPFKKQATTIFRCLNNLKGDFSNSNCGHNFGLTKLII